MLSSFHKQGQWLAIVCLVSGVFCLGASAVGQDFLDSQGRLEDPPPLGTDLQDSWNPHGDDDYYAEPAHHPESWLKASHEYMRCWMQEWNGGLDIGVNGTAGNQASTNLAALLAARRQVGATNQSLDAFYFYTHSDTSTTANSFYGRFRNEVALADLPFNWFVDGWYQYSHFNDSFFGFNTGISTTLIDDGVNRVIPRIGFGVPDLFLGLEVSRQLTDRQRIFGTLDFYPDFDFSNYRINMHAGWECVLNEETGFNMKLAAWDWYNHTNVQGRQSNDVLYLASLGWKF